MPYGYPIVDVELIDHDPGDAAGDPGAAQRLNDYLETRLVALRFDDHVRKRDRLELTLRNDDFALLDHPAFARGQKLRVSWGWPGRPGAPRRMIVTKVRGGNPVIVTAHCTSLLLDREPRARFRAGVTDAEFVREVAAEHGYTGTLAHIEATTARRDVVQPRQLTDERMLRRLARRNGFEFYIDATGLHWHRRATDRAPARVLHYRTDPGVGSIIEEPQVDVRLGPARVRVLGRDPYRKVMVDEAVGLRDEQDVSLGRDDELYDPEDADIGLRGARISRERVFSGGLVAPDAARAFASGQYRMTSSQRYRLVLTIIGDATIAAKQVIAVHGISASTDGLYFVREATTTITPGTFHMQLGCERDALAKAAAAKKRPPRANANADEWPWYGPEQFPLERMLTALVREDGQVVPGYLFTDSEGRTGQTSQLTWEEFEALSDRQKRALYDQGVNTSYPDP